MIKFRAWVKPGVLSNHLDGVIAEAKPDFLGMNCLVKRNDLVGKDCFTEIVDFEDLILMQSTEFKDNNDTEIFEGDVVNIHWFYADFDPVELGAFENEEYAERVTVKKEFGNFGFWWEEADSWVDLATLAMSARLDEESFEILGNIYENPELLSSGIE